MKMARILFWLMLSACMCACSQRASNKNEEVDIKPKKLAVADTLVTFYEDYPAFLDVRDDRLCVTLVKSDTCLALFDKYSGNLVKRLGVKGKGPQDMQSPEFVKNGPLVDAGRFVFYDLNQQKLFFLDKDGELGDFSPLTARYGSLNVTADYIVGHSTGFDPSLFLVKDRKTGEEKAMELHPKLPESQEERLKDMLRYMYSPHVLCNEAQNRIVLAMYFFDLVQIYNFQGELQKTLTLGEEKDFGQMVSELTNNGDYWGYSSAYATKDFCYLRRTLNEGATGEGKQSQIMKMDWEGRVMDIYDLDVVPNGGFCVDEDGKQYAIAHDIVEDEEVFLLLAFDER